MTRKPRNHVRIFFSVRMSRLSTQEFRERERGVRVARGAAKSNSSLLTALQTSQVLNISTYAQLKLELIALKHYQSDECSS